MSDRLFCCACGELLPHTCSHRFCAICGKRFTDANSVTVIQKGYPTVSVHIEYLDLFMVPYFQKMDLEHKVAFLTKGLVEGILLGEMIFADTVNGIRIADIERRKMVENINLQITELEKCRRCLTDSVADRSSSQTLT